MWLALLGYYLGYSASFAVWWWGLPALHPPRGGDSVMLWLSLGGLALALEMVGLRFYGRRLVARQLRKRQYLRLAAVALGFFAGQIVLIVSVASCWLSPLVALMLIALAHPLAVTIVLTLLIVWAKYSEAQSRKAIWMPR